MEIQSQVEDLSQSSNLLPIELSKLKNQLVCEKENLNHEEQGSAIFVSHRITYDCTGAPCHFSRLLAELDICQKSREIKRMNLENGHGMYEQNLALRFERQVEGSLVVKMHNIDPNDHKRQFYFSVRVEDDTNLYNGLMQFHFLLSSFFLVHFLSLQS